MNDRPTFSVIVPCYNHGQYIEEALDSILAQTFQDFEIIVVNDGSTDPSTVELLKAMDKPKTRVIHTPNQGPSTARNIGIRESLGRYILPVDSDDRITPTFLARAASILDSEPEVGIVYGRAMYFGARTGEWMAYPYSPERILILSNIPCSSCFRKEDWEKAGGFKTSMVYGYEDWDFWLSILELGRAVKHIDEITLYYRVREDSRHRSQTREQHVAMHAQIIRNHLALYDRHLEKLVGIFYDFSHSWLFKLHVFSVSPRFVLRRLWEFILRGR